MSELVQLLFGVPDPSPTAVLWAFADIAVVYYIIYRALLLIRGTRAVQMLLGLTLIILLFFASKDEYGNLPTLNWILDKVIGSFIFIIVVIFQKDIRRALVEVGRSPLFSGRHASAANRLLEELVRGACNLAQKHLGAIIVLERETDLSEYARLGVQLDAEVSKELIFSIFIPQYQNPLHDGALLVQKGKATAAACYLPLTEDPRLERSMGSRHRAAVGLTEETDALVIVVSEETGTISVAAEGRLVRGLDANTLRAELHKRLTVRPKVEGFWTRVGKRLRGAERDRARERGEAGTRAAGPREAAVMEPAQPGRPEPTPSGPGVSHEEGR